MATTDDPELAEFEARRTANRKTLALVGLVAVSALLLWKCSIQADRIGFGVGPGPAAKAAPTQPEFRVDRSGRVSSSGCYGDLDDCVARAKVQVKNGASDRIAIHAEPGAPAAVVESLRALITSYELVPAVD